MKAARSPLAYVIAAALTVLSPAAEKAKPDKLTLEDVIFDASYLKKMLGPKTLVATVAETDKTKAKPAATLADVTKAITEARLDVGTQIFVLPEGATPPKLQSSIPTTYPPGHHVTKDAIKADFLVFIGADGAIKCLYCYQQTDRLFALAAAMAVVKWRYTPAMIQGTAVPVLTKLAMVFDVDDAAIEGFKARKGPKTEGGGPMPRKEIRPKSTMQPGL